MKILLIGGTSFFGKEIVKLALEAGTVAETGAQEGHKRV